MKPIISSFGIDRRVLLSSLAVLPALSGSLLTTVAQAQILISFGFSQKSDSRPILATSP
jgi:hypothetical protein